MQLCLLVDTIGVRSDVQAAAASTWARPSRDVAAVWFVHDSLAFDAADSAEHPGFAFEKDGQLWLHQPARPEFRLLEGWREMQKRLGSSWPPPRTWTGNLTLEFEATVWHVCRRWRLLTADAVLGRLWPRSPAEHGGRRCTWLAYFRANAFVDTSALASVLRAEERRRGGAAVPMVLGRGMSADLHGAHAPMITWGGADLRSVWSSSGLFLNRAALALMVGSQAYQPGGGLATVYAVDITRWLLSRQNARSLYLSMAKERVLDESQAGTIELVFSATLRSQHRALSADWLPQQREQFLVGGLFLERFAFRLGAAAFRWSAVDQRVAGLGGAHAKRRAACSGLPPQCTLSFYPVDTAAVLLALQRAVPRAACLPSVDLAIGAQRSPTRLRSRFGLLHVWTSRGRLFVQGAGSSPSRPREAQRSPAWCAALRSNRRLWAALVAGPGERRAPGSRRFRLVPSARHAWGLGAGRPATLHADEWRRGPAGQTRLQNTVTLVATLPNSGSTWFLTCVQRAQTARSGCAAVNSDVLHPFCNALLSVEVSKVMGAPEDGTWPHIFRSPPPAALDLLMELVTDQLHARAIADVQYMRLFGVTVDGDPIPEAFQWPWKGLVTPRQDGTRIRTMLTKEVINIYPVMQHVEERYRSATSPAMAVVVLYRHRAHTFPMSNESEYLCKHCMFQRMLQSFQANAFPPDSALARLQEWWRARAPALGGALGPSGLVFTQLLASYVLLRAQAFGVRVLDYARLVSLELPELEAYLNATLPATLLRNPGAAAVAASCSELRMARPLEFLRRREQQYEQLGVETFARSAIAEMRRLDPTTDLSLLT